MKRKRMEDGEKKVPVEVPLDIFEKKVIQVIKQSELPAVLVGLELEKIKAAVDEEAERKLQNLYENMRVALVDEEQEENEERGTIENQNGAREGGGADVGD